MSTPISFPGSSTSHLPPPTTLLSSLTILFYCPRSGYGITLYPASCSKLIIPFSPGRWPAPTTYSVLWFGRCSFILSNQFRLRSLTIASYSSSVIWEIRIVGEHIADGINPAFVLPYNPLKFSFVVFHKKGYSVSFSTLNNKTFK